MIDLDRSWFDLGDLALDNLAREFYGTVFHTSAERFVQIKFQDQDGEFTPEFLASGFCIALEAYRIRR